MKILLWFAWKFVPSWYQQQRVDMLRLYCYSCDLLENSYLCGISNNALFTLFGFVMLWFAWKFVPLWYQQQQIFKLHRHWIGCDLLENSYLCGISNNYLVNNSLQALVVICLKIRTFVVSATTLLLCPCAFLMLWFAWKFVPLWYQQQLSSTNPLSYDSCDLLENSYLCGISNNQY